MIAFSVTVNEGPSRQIFNGSSCGTSDTFDKWANTFSAALLYLVVHRTNRKWVTTPVINGISRVSPLITEVITHLLSGMNHQVKCLWIPSMRKVVGSRVGRRVEIPKAQNICPYWCASFYLRDFVSWLFFITPYYTQKSGRASWLYGQSWGQSWRSTVTFFWPKVVQWLDPCCDAGWCPSSLAKLVYKSNFTGVYRWYISS